jgi:hypothetical protein
MAGRRRRLLPLAALAAPLVVLAAILTPTAAASLTKTPAAELAPATSLTRALTPEEPSVFSLGLNRLADVAPRPALFTGDELAGALDAPRASAEAGRFHPLAAVSLLSEDGAELPLVSGEASRFQKTRIGVFDFLGSRIIGVERELSLDLQWGSGEFGLRTSEGIGIWLSQDPLGDQDSVNLYGFVGGRPHEKTDPMGTCAGLDNVPCGEYASEFGNQFLFSNLWSTTKRSASFAAFEVKGAALAVPRLVKGVAQIAAHPVRTIQGLGTAAGEAIADPSGTARHIGNALLNADPDKAGEFVGETLGLVGFGAAAKTVEGAAALSRLKSAVSFGELTEAAGAGLADYGAEARYLEWKSGLRIKSTPGATAKDLFEIRQTSPLNYLVEGGGESFWADGLRSPNSILEAKYIVNPARSPFIPGTAIPPGVRQSIVGQVRGEFRRMGAIVADPSNPISRIKVITNSQAARPFFESLLEEFRIPGEVVIGR